MFSYGNFSWCERKPPSPHTISLVNTTGCAPTWPVVLHGRAEDRLRTFPDHHFDALITDPPYGLAEIDRSAQALQVWRAGDHSFMPHGRGFVGCSWDRFVPPPALWSEVLRVLRPGAPAAVFASPRTVDLMWYSLALAGFELVDVTGMVSGQVMPKASLISAAIDRRLGAVRVPGREREPASAEARRWGGYAGALKVAWEPVLILRAPGGSYTRQDVRSMSYQPKATNAERPSFTGANGQTVSHPSVKPLRHMTYLVKQLTWPGELILDPFAGSGTTGEASMLAGRPSVLIEQDPDSVKLCHVRFAKHFDAGEVGSDVVAAA